MDNRRIWCRGKLLSSLDENKNKKQPFDSWCNRQGRQTLGIATISHLSFIMVLVPHQKESVNNIKSTIVLIYPSHGSTSNTKTEQHEDTVEHEWLQSVARRQTLKTIPMDHVAMTTRYMCYIHEYNTIVSLQINFYVYEYYWFLVGVGVSGMNERNRYLKF